MGQQWLRQSAMGRNGLGSQQWLRQSAMGEAVSNGLGSQQWVRQSAMGSRVWSRGWMLQHGVGVCRLQ